jgi:hypothetical protein
MEVSIFQATLISSDQFPAMHSCLFPLDFNDLGFYLGIAEFSGIHVFT